MQQDAMLALAADFPKPDHQAWMAQVHQVLAKGQPDADAEALAARFEKLLITHSHDGLRIEPLNVGGEEAPALGYPGQAPFVRGSQAQARPWQVRQCVRLVGEPQAIATQVLDELARGTTALHLELQESPKLDLALLEGALRGVLLPLVPIGLEAGPRWAEAAEALLALWASHGLAPSERFGSLGADPVGQWLRVGGIGNLEAAQSQANALARKCLAWPGVRALVVDAALLHESGGGEVEELAVGLALGVHQLRELTRLGLSVDEACGQLEFRYAATPDQFLSLAKLRAARRLWQRVTESSGASEAAQAQVQHAISSTATSSRYDPWVNLLRHTVASFGAGLGGAQAITVRPHDALLVPGGSPLGRRLARNTQLLLLEEAHLAKVADIGGGSFHVEALTEQLAQKAWAFFRDIERAGGVVPALRLGLVQDRVAAVRSARDQAIAKRKHPLTGLSEFPDILEAPPAPLAPATPAAKGEVQPLVPHRHAEAFEAQRGRADALALRTGQRPKVFLASLGKASAFTARATFAKNLFEVGGIEAVGGEGYADPASALAAFEASQAEFACLCSNDATYAELALPVAQALKGAKRPPLRLYLAGKPTSPSEAEGQAAGVDERLAMGSDVLALLTRALDVVEAQRSASTREA